jgi:hypothetical protein
MDLLDFFLAKEPVDIEERSELIHVMMQPNLVI